MVYTFIAEEKANPDCPWSVSEMCRVLEVSRSGFYDWEIRPPSERELSDRQLAVEIEAIWETSGRTYGSPRVFRWLRRQGFNPYASGSLGSCVSTASKESPVGAGCAPRSSTVRRKRPATG